MSNPKHSAKETVLTGSVGLKGANQRKDVKLVQFLLNDWLGRRKEVLLKVDGLVGPLTIGAIEEFQRQNGLESDGRVDRDGPSLAQLVALHLAGVESGLVPSEFLTLTTKVPSAGAPLSREAWAEAMSGYLVMLRKSL